LPVSGQGRARQGGDTRPSALLLRVFSVADREVGPSLHRGPQAAGHIVTRAHVLDDVLNKLRVEHRVGDPFAHARDAALNAQEQVLKHRRAVCAVGLHIAEDHGPREDIEGEEVGSNLLYTGHAAADPHPADDTFVVPLHLAGKQEGHIDRARLV
jgi:hypothetical protein